MNLVGKIVYFTRDGYRSGKVRRVATGRHGIKSLTVNLLGGTLNKYTGPKVCVFPKDFRAPLTGVLFRGKIYPLDGLPSPSPRARPVGA